MTIGKVADCKVAYKIKKGDIVVANRGYQDFELLIYWYGNHIKFVVRHSEGIKYNSSLRWILKEGENEHIIQDEYIRMSGQESSAYDEPLRRVVVYNEKHGYKVELLSYIGCWGDSANIPKALVCRIFLQGDQTTSKNQKLHRDNEKRAAHPNLTAIADEIMRVHDAH